MADIQLFSDEYVFAELQQVFFRQGIRTKVGSLMLTNKRLLYSSIGSFGIKKLAGEWKVSDIKIFDDAAQVKVSSGNGTQTQLDVFFRSGQVSFMVNGAGNPDVAHFANQLNRAVTGRDEDIYVVGEKPSAAKSLFKAMLGSGYQEADKVDRARQKVAIKCPHCGGPIEGIRGKVARCPYCDSVFNA